MKKRFASRIRGGTIGVLSVLLLVGGLLPASAQSAEETRDFAEYLMTGYPEFEGAAPLKPIARDVIRKEFVSGGVVSTPAYVITGYDIRPMYGTQKIDSRYNLGIYDMSIGRVDLGFEGFVDLYSYINNAFGYGDSVRDPTLENFYLRSIGPERFGEYASVDELHVKTNHVGGLLEVDLFDTVRLTADAALATFDHIAVDYAASYDPDDGLSADERSDLGDTVSTQRQRLRGEVAVFPSRIFEAAPRYVPDEIGVDVVLRDELTPEGYSFSSRFIDDRLGSAVATVGYGEVRDVVFLNTTGTLAPVATTITWEAEVDEGGTGDLFTKRLFAGIELLGLAAIIAYGENPRDMYTAEDLYVSVALGPEYQKISDDIVEQYLYTEKPRDWALTLSMQFLFLDMFAGYLNMKLSEMVYFMRDEYADAQLRAGLMVRF